jgi:hypothetical protein
VKLSELIAHVGDENIQIQNLLNCADEVTLRKGVTRITFGTNAISAVDVMHNTVTKMGLVIWFDKDRLPPMESRADTRGLSGTDRATPSGRPNPTDTGVA